MTLRQAVFARPAGLFSIRFPPDRPAPSSRPAFSRWTVPPFLAGPSRSVAQPAVQPFPAVPFRRLSRFAARPAGPPSVRSAVPSPVLLAAPFRLFLSACPVAPP